MFKHPTEITCTQGFLKQQLKSINNSVRCIQGFWKRAFCNTAINNYHFEFILYNMIHYINKLVELQLQHCQTAPR